MEQDELAETVSEAGEQNRKSTALFISTAAVLLGLASVGGDNAAEDMISNNIAASDTFSFYQAKNVRQTAFRLAADQMAMQLTIHPDLPEPARTALRERIDLYRATEKRYESEPETGEGKKELMAKAKAFEEERDRAAKRGPYFDASEVLLQLAIVLASITLIVRNNAILWLSFGLAALGTLALADAFTLAFEVPFL